MIQPSQREKILIVTTATVLLVVVSVAIWRPLLRSWRQTNAQIELKERQRNEMRATLERQPALRQQYADLHQRLQSLRGSAAVPDVLQKVGQLAREAGVNVRSRTPQPTREQRGFTEVPIDYTLEASVESLVRFLHDIRAAQDLLDVTELKVVPNPQNPALLRVDMRIVSLRATSQ